MIGPGPGAPWPRYPQGNLRAAMAQSGLGPSVGLLVAGAAQVQVGEATELKDENFLEAKSDYFNIRLVLLNVLKTLRPR